MTSRINVDEEPKISTEVHQEMPLTDVETKPSEIVDTNEAVEVSVPTSHEVSEAEKEPEVIEEIPAKRKLGRRKTS